MLFKDPSFSTGVNGTTKYANSGASNVNWTRAVKSSDNPITGTNYEMICTNTGSAAPGLGGFYWSHQSRKNAVFLYRIIAKIPTGHNIQFASNAVGDDTRGWLTSNAGTGKFTEYVFKLICGSTGTFSTTGYFYIDGTAGTSSTPVTWYVAYATVFDMSTISEVNNYITYVNENDGIKVHNSNDTTNYLQLNSSTISMYKGDTKIFNIDNNGYVIVGKVAADKRNIYITDSAVQIRNNTSVLAEYGSSIKLYNPTTTTVAVEISSTGASFTGNVKATSLSTGTKTASTTGKGTYIDGNGNIYVGNGSTNNFTVTDTGTITATGANLLTATIGNATNKITIGTGTSGHSSIRYGMTTLADTSHDGFYIGTDGIALGKGKFKVTAAGAITATSLSIGISQVTDLQTTLNGKQPSGDYATNTALTNATGWSVIINISAINYTANTATLHATVYKDGVIQTTGFTLQWYKT